MNPLVSRRWRPGSKESPGCNAGADCAACGVAAEPETGRWRCPRCGAVADGCGDTYGLKACELLAGHEDAHESRSGTSWPQRSDAERPTSKRFTCGNHGCPLDFGHEGDCAPVEATPEAPGDLPEVACKVFFNGEEVATATGVELRVVPPALEALGERIAWTKGVDWSSEMFKQQGRNEERARVLRWIDTHASLGARWKRVRKALARLRADIEGRG